MSAITAVLFDKDGTLLEDVGTWFPIYSEMLRHFGETDDEVIMRALVAGGYDPDTHSFRGGSVLAAGTNAEIMDLWWPDLSSEERHERIDEADRFCSEKGVKHVAEVMPLEPVLNQLRSSGFRTGIATNDSCSSAVQQMRQLGLSDLFDQILGFDSVVRPKPAGDVVHAFCNGLSLRPENVAMVGDNSHDMLCARDAGAGLAIGVLSGSSSHDELSELADLVVEDIGALHELLTTSS